MNYFQYVHPDISRILEMEPPESMEDDTTVIRGRAQREQRLVVIENSVTVIDWASLEEYIHQHRH
jgi:hypothetical protein